MYLNNIWRPHESCTRVVMTLFDHRKYHLQYSSLDDDSLTFIKLALTYKQLGHIDIIIIATEVYCLVCLFIA